MNQLKTLFDSGKLEQAEQEAEKLVSCFPNISMVWNALGNIQIKMEKLEEAALSYSSAVSTDEGSYEARVNLASVLVRKNIFTAAYEQLQKAIKLNDEPEEAYFYLAKIHQLKGEVKQAEEFYRRALELKPNNSKTLNNLGSLFQSIKQKEKAKICLLESLKLNPKNAETLTNLAITVSSMGNIVEAEKICKKALEVNPSNIGAANNLAGSLSSQGFVEQALDLYREGITSNEPSLAQFSNYLFTLNYVEGNSPELVLNEARKFSDLVKACSVTTYKNGAKSIRSGKLRVGFVSGDLINHPVGFFLKRVLENLDLGKIDLYSYATHFREDSLTGSIKPLFSKWQCIYGETDEAAAERIEADKLDILIDLAGHTAHNRLGIFARKPAPVQATWLGYFATTGLKEIDYILVDEVGIKESSADHFSEKPWILPQTRMCFSPPEFATEVSSLPVLEKGYITFGSYQKLDKISDRSLTLWSKIISQVTNSKLRLQCKSFDDKRIQIAFSAKLKSYNIDKARVELHGTCKREDYLKSYEEIDLILDTFPYPGGTTTCEAFWMGVPTVTLAGNTLLSRQGASMLTAAGLENWVAETEIDFIEKAVGFARDHRELAQCRAELRQQVSKSPLFDAALFAQRLESALFNMSDRN